MKKMIVKCNKCGIEHEVYEADRDGGTIINGEYYYTYAGCECGGDLIQFKN